MCVYVFMHVCASITVLSHYDGGGNGVVVFGLGEGEV